MRTWKRCLAHCPRRYASANDKKAQVSDLGLTHGAGDENRTRALSLGSDGASRVRSPLTCGYVFWSAFSATCSAPLFTVVVRSYGHAVGTRLVGAASRRAAGHLAMRNAWRGSTAATVTCVCTLLTEDAKITKSVSLGTDFDLRRRQPGVLGEEAADVVDRDGARRRRGCCGPARSAPAGPGAVAGLRRRDASLDRGFVEYRWWGRPTGWLLRCALSVPRGRGCSEVCTPAQVGDLS